ncbi:LOW QUALITY PROTEIN: uncharacterized protein EMH_0069860 [Eimeria mitis]|uniref:Uncharacterized protein n=1 Tax=Eimeria mitis TaxID=44415 RepID=U6KHC9_9EIME|nr:LOW QUALITY PROTEIN: uncharacterized protein EMH_0069860 [Eimeria mitis]CDJ36206.1 hypothetical protein, conserved [Eimeria mitis]
MQIPLGTLELQYPVGHRDGSTLCRGSQDAGAKSAKKSLFEGAAQALGGDDHESIDALPRPSSDQSSTQRQTDSFLEYQFSGGPHGPDEASAASVTEKFETAPHGTESAADADLIDAFLTEGDGIDQWFLDFILDPTSTSSAGSGLEDVKSTKELAGEVEAKTGDQVTPSSSSSSEGQSPAAPGSTSADARPVAARALKVRVRPLLAVPSHDYSSAASSSIYQLLHFTPQHLTSTGPLDAPRPLHSQIPADEGALRHHPFYRLPRADCSHNLIPFSFSRATILTPQTRIPEVLTSIQTLLMKPHLGSDEVQSLMMLAEKLVKDVFCMGRFTKGFVRFWSLCESIMRRFIIADALWSICEVVGPSMRMQEWWGPVMDRLLVLPSAKVSFLQTQTDRFLIVRRLIAALHTYRAGRRPSASEVIALKREIFCSGNGPGSFRSPAYDMFRSIDGC